MATPAPGAPAREVHRPEFSGTAAEYFRVWVVNVALTVVTLGIYSAWAKVRNRQYFYGNTRLAGDSFEYTANPLNILKGRLLVLCSLAAYQLAVSFQPMLAFALGVAFIPLFPWVVIKAVSFNLRYSAYRGLRFHFDGTYGESFRVYVLWTAAAIASFGLAYPYVAWRRKKFLVERARYGTSAFSFDGEPGWFYVVYIIAAIGSAGLFMGLTVLMTGALALGAMVGSGAAGSDSGDMEGVGTGLAIGFGLLMYAAIALYFIVLNTGVQALLANHVWQKTRITGVGFDLRLNLWRIVWIQFSNITAIILSLGLLIPWARVRMVRYRLSCFALLAVPSELEQFVAAERERVEATGAEFGDALDLDLGL